MTKRSTITRSVLAMMYKRHLQFICAIFVLLLAAPQNTRAQEAQNFFPELAVTLDGDKQGQADLTITAPHPHRYEFGIVTPTGELLFVYATLLDGIAMDNPNDIVGFWDSITLSLNTSTLKGIYYNNGRPVSTKIFKESGLYCLHFSSNFETHPGGTHYQAIDIQWPSPTTLQRGLNNGKCLDEFYNRLNRSIMDKE
ncbi:MAG: hypothetical protein PVF65_10250 [Sphingomonadales bacterium]|jgi:hypothetical protein